MFTTPSGRTTTQKGKQCFGTRSFGSRDPTASQSGRGSRPRQDCFEVFVWQQPLFQALFVPSFNLQIR